MRGFRFLFLSGTRVSGDEKKHRAPQIQTMISNRVPASTAAMFARSETRNQTNRVPVKCISEDPRVPQPKAFLNATI